MEMGCVVWNDLTHMVLYVIWRPASANAFLNYGWQRSRNAEGISFDDRRVRPVDSLLLNHVLRSRPPSLADRSEFDGTAQTSRYVIFTSDKVLVRCNAQFNYTATMRRAR